MDNLDWFYEVRDHPRVMDCDSFHLCRIALNGLNQVSCQAEDLVEFFNEDR